MLPHYIPPAPPAHAAHSFVRRNTTTIQHVVVVIQENRTVDNMFNGFCVSTTQCANTVTVDPYQGITLKQVSLGASYDLDHSHIGFVNDYDNGAMDGFANNAATAYGYVPSSETVAYRQMFSWDGVFNDMTFAANQGPSLPAHEYGIAGQAGGYESSREDIAENPEGVVTCATPMPMHTPGQVKAVSLATPFPGYPEEDTPICRDHKTIFDQLSSNISWRYYAEGTLGLWMPTQAIEHLYNSPNFIEPAERLLTDIGNGQLANIVFVTPATTKSDHPGFMVGNPTAGGTWVASIVNAIGQSAYWNNTVIVLYWDDFGGWYDHVLPHFAPDPFILSTGKNPNEYGFRVPYGVISAYAKVGSITHNVCSFSDSLNFIEQTFGLQPLGTEDVYNTGCTAAMLNLNKPPDPFRVIDGSSPPGRPRHPRSPWAAQH